MNQAFNNCKHNLIHLTFPNGNQISILWGIGSYSENHNMGDNYEYEDFKKLYSTFLASNTAEVMILKADDKAMRKIKRKFGKDDSVYGYLTITEVMWILNALNN